MATSQLMRWVISELYILWKVCNTREEKTISTETVPNLWKPWEHIYSLCKAVKDHMPLYNQGSYAVWKSMEKYGIWFEYFPGLEKYGKNWSEYGKIFMFPDYCS